MKTKKHVSNVYKNSQIPFLPENTQCETIKYIFTRIWKSWEQKVITLIKKTSAFKVYFLDLPWLLIWWPHILAAVNTQVDTKFHSR